MRDHAARAVVRERAPEDIALSRPQSGVELSQAARRGLPRAATVAGGACALDAEVVRVLAGVENWTIALPGAMVPRESIRSNSQPVTWSRGGLEAAGGAAQHRGAGDGGDRGGGALTRSPVGAGRRSPRRG